MGDFCLGVIKRVKIGENRENWCLGVFCILGCKRGFG